MMLRRALFMAMRRAASDPQMRQKVKGAVEQGVARARPYAQKGADTLRGAAHDASPFENPRGFAEALKRRWRGEPPTSG
ncbi:MAG: hypothetical protein RLO50_17070 [Azospirillaceae bacterium]